MKSGSSLNKDVGSYTENHSKHAPRWKNHGLSFAVAFAALATCLNVGTIASDSRGLLEPSRHVRLRMSSTPPPLAALLAAIAEKHSPDHSHLY
jgi:hypothetical protein